MADEKLNRDLTARLARLHEAHDALSAQLEATKRELHGKTEEVAALRRELEWERRQRAEHHPVRRPTGSRG